MILGVGSVVSARSFHRKVPLSEKAIRANEVCCAGSARGGEEGTDSGPKLCTGIAFPSGSGLSGSGAWGRFAGGVFRVI